MSSNFIHLVVGVGGDQPKVRTNEGEESGTNLITAESRAKVRNVYK